jgi:hypothetical protein
VFHVVGVEALPIPPAAIATTEQRPGARSGGAAGAPLERTEDPREALDDEEVHADQEDGGEQRDRACGQEDREEEYRDADGREEVGRPLERDHAGTSASSAEEVLVG